MRISKFLSIVIFIFLVSSPYASLTQVLFEITCIGPNQIQISASGNVPENIDPPPRTYFLMLSELFHTPLPNIPNQPGQFIVNSAGGNSEFSLTSSIIYNNGSFSFKTAGNASHPNQLSQGASISGNPIFDFQSSSNIALAPSGDVIWGLGETGVDIGDFIVLNNNCCQTDNNSIAFDVEFESEDNITLSMEFSGLDKETFQETLDKVLKTIDGIKRQ